MEKSDKQKELEKWLNDKSAIQRKELDWLWGCIKSNTKRILQDFQIKPLFLLRGNYSGMGCVNYAFYSRAECEAARPFIKEVKNEMEEQKLINTPLEDDFIPADTLDSYTLTALIVKLKEKGAIIENFKADLFDNHADEDIKRIGMLIRGSVKSVNLWGRQIDEVVNVCEKKEIVEDLPVIEKTQQCELITPNADKSSIFLAEVSTRSLVARALLSSAHITFTDNTMFIICKEPFSAKKLMESQFKQKFDESLRAIGLIDYEIVIIDKTNGRALMGCFNETKDSLSRDEVEMLSWLRERFKDGQFLFRLGQQSGPNSLRGKKWGLVWGELEKKGFVAITEERPKTANLTDKGLNYALPREEDFIELEGFTKVTAIAMESRLKRAESQINKLESFISDLKILLAKHA